MTAKDHAKGNDLASNNPDSNSSPSNPPSESTLNTEIDKLLEAYSYGYTTPTGKIGKDQAKSEIIKLVNRAKIDELKNLYVDFDERKLRHIEGTKLIFIDERIRELGEDKQ